MIISRCPQLANVLREGREHSWRASSHFVAEELACHNLHILPRRGNHLRAIPSSMGLSLLQVEAGELASSLSATCHSKICVLDCSGGPVVGTLCFLSRNSEPFSDYFPQHVFQNLGVEFSFLTNFYHVTTLRLQESKYGSMVFKP